MVITQVYECRELGEKVRELKKKNDYHYLAIVPVMIQEKKTKNYRYNVRNKQGKFSKKEVK